LDSGQSTQVTNEIADSHEPAFDRDGKFLYFFASTNSGATSDGLDMTSDLYNVTSNIYALVLAADQASPIAPELDDEKSSAEKKSEAKKETDGSSDQETAAEKDEAKAGDEKPKAKEAPKAA